MKRQIRRGAFETNSSSMHAICITKSNVDYEFPEKLEFKHGEFGWGFEVLTEPEDKASYLYEAICALHDRNLEHEYINKIFHILGEKGVEAVFPGVHVDEDGWSLGYIDHVGDTREFVEAVMHSEKRLLKYLFGDSYIVVGNDNDDDYDEYMDNNDFSGYEVYEKGN